MSGVLPVDRRGPAGVGADGNNAGDGGAGEGDGELQGGDPEREGVFGDLREGVSDEGRFHSLGDSADA